MPPNTQATTPTHSPKPWSLRAWLVSAGSLVLFLAILLIGALVLFPADSEPPGFIDGTVTSAVHESGAKPRVLIRIDSDNLHRYVSDEPDKNQELSLSHEGDRVTIKFETADRKNDRTILAYDDLDRDINPHRKDSK